MRCPAICLLRAGVFSLVFMKFSYSMTDFLGWIWFLFHCVSIHLRRTLFANEVRFHD